MCASPMSRSASAPAPARDSYLDGGAIIAAAKRAGADAVHPGYGFLSEDAAFAEACMEAGLVWVGPPPAAMRAMGSKSAAKALMEKSGVPVLPGYHGADQEPAHLAQEADRIGFPVVIKAVAGGGGRGMRVVRGAAAFADALASAQQEGRSAFGDSRVLIERYLERPRHIEVQVFGDTHGNVVHLFERDCSAQRRHQKVIEEAPAPGLDAVMREAMGQAAVAAARAVGYVGAGTVEFVAEEGGFWFLEMNTRLQVEHPVTEMHHGFRPGRMAVARRGGRGVARERRRGSACTDMRWKRGSTPRIRRAISHPPSGVWSRSACRTECARGYRLCGGAVRLRALRCDAGQDHRARSDAGGCAAQAAACARRMRGGGGCDQSRSARRRRSRIPTSLPGRSIRG